MAQAGINMTNSIICNKNKYHIFLEINENMIEL
jgi:hypothetical protein